MQHNLNLNPPARQPAPLQATQSFSPDVSNISSHHHVPSPAERLVARTPHPSASHSRDVSLVRGRGLEAGTLGLTTLQSQHRAPSVLPQSQEANVSRNAVGLDAGLERKPSNLYGHHRQTSIVHGIQHSRNASFTNSTSPSPLSPDTIASSGLGGTALLDTGINARLDSMNSPAAHLNAGASGTTQSPSLMLSNDPATGDMVNGTGQARKATMGGRARRENSHHHSQSDHNKAKTVGEYALHHLFNSFVGQADQKINQCISGMHDYEDPVEQLCGPGADPTFDQLISALGHVARLKPKPLIDTIMFWRKAKGDTASSIKQQTHHSKSTGGLPAALLRRNTEPVPPSMEVIASDTDLGQAFSPPAASRDEELRLAERRATVSVYLVCRVLIEIFDQSSLAAITPDLAARLEDIVYGQLKACDPDQIAQSSLRMANWRIYGQLLGIMSGLNLVSVSGRFLTDLERFQRDTTKGAASSTVKDAEARAELLILSTRHLKIKAAPEEAWIESCDFMRSMARLFVNAHGQRIKQAYCQALERLLIPVAADLACDMSAPKWREFLDILNPRLTQMLTKIRHWSSSFPLSTLLLCVSPKEAFMTQWTSITSSLAPKLKERSTRGPALQAICRITWTYIYRAAEGPASAMRRIEEVIRIAMPMGKKTYLSTESSVAEPLIQLIRLIGYRYQELCFRTIIFPLINSDLFASGRELKIENMEPEKMVIGIRAFLAIMSDLENGDYGRPPFPASFAANPLVDPLPTSPILIRPQLLVDPKRSAALKTDNLSLPVDTSSFGDVAKQYYIRFCEILGKITLLCDNTFGGQAALDEKFSGLTPKTPLTDVFPFGRRDDHQSGPEQKQGFYDLLHVAVQALPRFLSDHIPFNSLINLLCTGTAHVQSNIAISSAQSLKSIARQSHAQQVTIGFARFIFSFDARYSTMSDEGMLGPGHIENTLTLYVELLNIWIAEIKQKSKEAKAENPDKTGAGARGVQLDLSATMALVEEIESHGLFFLCSQSRRVRSFAITVLRLVTDFDKALGKEKMETTRIIRILETDSQKILELNDDHLNVAERSRLQKGKRKSASQSTVIELCSSEVSYDSTLWMKLFPNLVRISFDLCPFAVMLGREIVCSRLLQMHKSIESLAESPRIPPYTSLDFVQGRSGNRNTTTSPEILIEQWKLYLVMACTTINTAGAQSQSQLANAVHARKQSKNGSLSTDKISSARSLFAFVIPLLSAGPDSIRNAIVTALGSINKNLYRTLLESLQYAVTKCNDEAKVRIATHHRTPSSPLRNRKTDRLRTEVTHVYKLTSHFLKDSQVYNDDWILNNLVTYTKDLRIFLNDAEVQNDFEFQRLRYHYCGLMEEVFEGINRSKSPARWMPFESRKSAFALMEEWCGYSPNQGQIAQREDAMRQMAIAQQQESGERTNVTAAMEIEKKNLRTAALSAMASLCGGPVKVMTESKAILQFNVNRMLSWIDTIFSTVSDKLHAIGRRALKNLVIHNKEYPYLLEHAIERCYLPDRPKALESYFEVVSEVLIEHEDYQIAFWRIIGAVLFTLGHEKREIRMKTAHLLRTLEERQEESLGLQDFDVSISDKTVAVYKEAQFEYSRRLAAKHSDLAFIIFSEFSLRFKSMTADGQRGMVAAILPWVQTIELQLDPSGGPTANSYMLLANLFEITVRSSGVLHNEVQALWKALATGPHGGNVQLVLDFIISQSMQRREQNFVDYAKQIVVFLSVTPAGSKVTEFFLLQMVPKSMVNEKKETTQGTPPASGVPYIANLEEVLPLGAKQAGFSLGQVCLIFLVDLMVGPPKLPSESIIKILHVLSILWDHYTITVQEQAREMLVHLIHELVTSKVADKVTLQKKKQIEDLVASIRRNEPQVVWNYEDDNFGDEEESGSRVPSAMTALTKEVIDIFGIAYEGVSDLWAKEALNWATSCPVRHLACRSFQVFRCISSSLDSRMLADMLARLSNTIADEETDYQTFSMEILTTLKIIIGSLHPQDLIRYPQLFWTTIACLNTIHEREFVESLGMLEKVMEKLDMGDPLIVAKMIEGRPPKWEGGFDGIEPLVYKGLKSAESLDKTLLLLHRLAAVPSNNLVGDDSRLLYAILANLPSFLHQQDLDVQNTSVVERARRLARVAEGQRYDLISRCLHDYANGQLTSSGQFLDLIISAVRSCFFPDFDVRSLVFLMGLLTNKTSWFRLKTMTILCVIIPDIDMRRPEVSCHGPDLISPLLRLLQTDLCPQALEVMDHIMTVSGNPNERHHIRMSMASGSSRAIRKEYERTQSLYGIPEPTGWSIPMPAVHSTTTRNNVHAVFYTCAEADRREAQAAATPEVEFHADEYSDSYFTARRTATMKSVDTQADGNMGDLVQKLDSLDDFFDEPDTAHQSMTSMSMSASTLGSYTSEMHENGANIYDQQTAPILRKSLARTASSSSFHNGLAESRPSTSREVGVMTPTAFATAPQLNNAPMAPVAAAAAGLRPKVHSRSITSPANEFSASGAGPPMPYNPLPTSSNVGGSFLSDDEGDGVLSESEERFPALAQNPSSSFGNPGVPPANPRVAATTPDGPFSLEGVMRRGMRRLTGGTSKADREKERQRDLVRAQQRALTTGPNASGSPRVPRVPAEYLNGAGASPTTPGI